MIDDQMLVFVEGKQRLTNRFGRPEESVGMSKHAKLRRTVGSNLQCSDKLQSWSCRFDVVVIKDSSQAPVHCWTQNAYY